MFFFVFKGSRTECAAEEKISSRFMRSENVTRICHQPELFVPDRIIFTDSNSSNLRKAVANIFSFFLSPSAVHNYWNCAAVKSSFCSVAPEKGKTLRDGGGIFQVENGAAAKYPPTTQVDPNAHTEQKEKNK